MQISNLPAVNEEAIKNDPLALAVKTIVDAMRTDFGERFIKSFSDAEQVRQLKRRLYAKLKGLHPGDIYDGYEALVERNPNFVPAIPEIIESILHCKKIREKDEKNALEAQKISGLPKPEISESLAKQNLKKIHELLGEAFKHSDKKETEEERKARLLRLEEKRVAHEALLKQSVPSYGKTIIDPGHKCSVGWCDRPGVLSSSTSGGSNFFCNEHFKQGS